MSNIIIRSSTMKSLNLQEDSILHRLITEACVNICYYGYSEVFPILFKLLYGDTEERNQQLYIYGITYQPADENTEYNNPENLYVFHTENQVKAFANELRHQYSRINPNFLKVNENPHYEKELSDLKKSMSNVPMLFYIAVTSCSKIHDNRKQVEFCYEMMISDEERNVISGLKNMGHNSKHTDLLLPYAKKIAILLMAMSDAFEEEHYYIQENQIQATLGSTPFDGLSQLLKDNGYELPAECETETESEAEVKDSEIAQSNSKATQYEDLFQRYFQSDNSRKLEILKDFRKAGLDLNHFFDKEILIETSFSSFEAAKKLLALANENFDKVCQELSLTNATSIYNLLAARQSLDAIIPIAETAKNRYYKLIEEFASA